MKKKLDEENANITKRSHVYKGYISIYNVQILNCLNLELQLQDTEYAIRNKEIVYSYQLKVFNFYNIAIGTVKKLVLKFFDKENYAFHHEDLRFYLRLGLKLKKVHTVLEFNQ